MPIFSKWLFQSFDKFFIAAVIHKKVRINKETYSKFIPLLILNRLYSTL